MGKSKFKIDADLSDDIPISVARALAEDIGAGDLTASLVPEAQTAQARVISRESAVLCGQPWFDEVFRQLDTSIEVDWKLADGDLVAANDLICEVRGPARAVLTGERAALNFTQLLSASATAARRYVDAVAGTGVTILDTRKTVPGLRLAQKYAVRCGGASNHRIGLFDAVLIKENHIVAAGGVAAAANSALKISGKALIEVEVENLRDARRALDAGVDRLLLDNFDLADLREAVALRNEIAGDITLEASGGITLANVHDVASTGVDFISIGALTKDIKAIDLSMRFELSNPA